LTASSAIALHLVNRLDALADLEAAIDEFCSRYAIGKKQWHRCRLVAEELFVNIITHGYEDGHPGSIDWTIAREGDEIHFIIQDDGAEFSPRDPKPKALSLEEVDDVGGHGTRLISALATSVQFTRQDGQNRCHVVMEAR